MKKTKKRIIFLSTILIVCISLFTIYYNRKPLLKATSNWLTAQTIPFNLLVNPNKINKSIHPHAIALNEIDNQKYQEDLTEIDNLINSFNRHQQKFSWLSPTQTKKLQKRIKQKPHRYISSITPLLLGQDRTGQYTVLSINCYDDTTQIRSYRYRVYFRNHRSVKSHYLKTTTNTKPPKFIGFTNTLGVSGITKAPNFIDTINSTLTNSDVANQPNASSHQYSQLGKNIGLKNSGSALQQYALNSDANYKNSAITGYEISDVPRETKFFITQINKETKHYYTLIYNRNQGNFTGFQTGKHTVADIK
ncbi:hypothetical protein DS830_07380 [Bombilactobacillus bombi]|uniref:hypothetical protein n=1 Tax=Bombilactobacillus bombi TaxID=1303590 RepID=UPI000E58E5FC|nr:hypothetical protein [Bombilactobacillus bombi]AXX65311.1 hypothetical protein DS830_07380 [Bombilactobacillus bombi]